MRLVLSVFLALAGLPLAVTGQQPAFAVVSIRPAEPGARLNANPQIGGNRLSDNAINLEHLFYAAFGIQPFQIQGLPDWAGDDLFSIQAVADGLPDRDQMLAMLQTALIDRFSLKLSVVQKKMRVFALSVAPGGVKYGKVGDDAPPRDAGARLPGHARVNFGTTIPAMVRALNERHAMDLPVIDATGIADTGLRLALDLVEPVPPDSAASTGRRGGGGSLPQGKDLIDALESQLGLTLAEKTADVNVYSIRGAARPTPN